MFLTQCEIWKSSTLIFCGMERKRNLPGFAESNGSMWHFWHNKRKGSGIFLSLHFINFVSFIQLNTYPPHLIPVSYCYSDALQCHICCTLIDKFMQNPNKCKELFEFLSISMFCLMPEFSSFGLLIFSSIQRISSLFQSLNSDASTHPNSISKPIFPF